MKQYVDEDEREVGSLRFPDHARVDGHHKDVRDYATGTRAYGHGYVLRSQSFHFRSG